jgi:formamidopyrimidine-DNA glycosylase
MKPGEADQWPPKFWKFQLETDSKPSVEVAFTDPRRFGRVRLVTCPGDEVRKHSPLVENGPDPVVDKDIFTEEFLRTKMTKRHVPIKALLLDQAMISGIGNWVADEVLYQSKLHPEQYSDDFSDSQIQKLYEAIRFVTQMACDKLGDSDQFPDDWLFNYRWGKGGKGASSALPNGEKLAFITVGGRTSCYAPGVQKKTGRVAPGMKVEPLDGEANGAEEAKPSKKQKKVVAAESADQPAAKRPKTAAVADSKDQPVVKRKQTTRDGGAKNKTPTKTEEDADLGIEDFGRRRSGRLKGRSS